MHYHKLIPSPLLIAASILLSSETCIAFPPSFRRSASITLRTFEAVDMFSSTAVANGDSSNYLSYKAFRCPTTIYSSAAASSDGNNSNEEESKSNYIRPYLKQLLLLCRPINFPIVFLFHVLGVHQALEFWKATMQPVATPMLFSMLTTPSMLFVFISLMMVTSTSMITNDYYDARLGVDVVPAEGSKSGEYEHYHPLAEGTVPFTVTKTFDSYLYAILLFSSAFVPGVIPRLMVIWGAITTYLYTVHLKPKTWIKNISCAALVAMSPITSGLATWQVLRETSMGASSLAASSSIPFGLIFHSPLTYLVLSLFAGIMSREILMDIADCEGDARAGIQTIPVKYGKNFAANVAMVCTIISVLSACGEWISKLMTSGADITSMAMSASGMRKLLLSVLGSGFFAAKTYAVFRTKGDDYILAEKAVREGLLGVLLVLFSFM